jgi:glycosyltransferase involved in cell wall biosynthesis
VVTFRSMPMPVITAVLTVYNKADVLPRVLTRLRDEARDLLGEVVAVEDASTDASLEVLTSAAAHWPALRVLHDGENHGPSRRLNEGAELARGEWLLLIDGDALIRSGAIAGLYRLATAGGLDALHARMARLQHEPADGASTPFPDEPRVTLSDEPLETVLTQRGIVRMAWLVRRRCFLAAAGADPGVFIQDESLSLRLAAAADRIGLCREVAVFEPAAAFNLSGDRRQQHHDRFMAHYRFLKAPPRRLSPREQRGLVDRCLGAARRAARSGLLPGRSPLCLRLRLRRWLAGRGLGPDPIVFLDRLAHVLLGQPQLKRPSSTHGGTA